MRCSHTLPLLQDDEYVVYSPEQVRLKYVVQFCMEGDQLKEFSPDISTTAEPCLPPTVQGENCTPPPGNNPGLFLPGYLSHLLLASDALLTPVVGLSVQSCVRRTWRWSETLWRT